MSAGAALSPHAGLRAEAVAPYAVDRSLAGKARRRLSRLAARRPARAPGKPMISFAFDDAPASATRLGAATLERRGVRGTYFIAAGWAGRDSPCGVIAEPDDLVALAEAGHEIGCHTFSHLDCGRGTDAVALADVERNRLALEAWGLPAPSTFAFPYGDVSLATKRALAARFTLCRALHRGLVEAGADLNQAPAVGVEGPDGEAKARAWLARAAARRSWLILYTHDVADSPSPWGCTPKTLGRLADRALEAGFEVVTVAEGARRVSG